jgi:hypothetical protein
MERCPIISKYCVRCLLGAPASSSAWAKLSPSMGGLGDALDDGGRLDPERLQDRGNHVDGMPVLGAHFPLGLDPLGQWTMKGSLMPPR